MPAFKLDNLDIQILEDGTIKFTTDAVSGANHANAEQFLRLVGDLAGGETKRVRRPDRVHHHHDHVHHQHVGGGHDHDHEH